MPKPVIICIDDEPTILDSLKRELRSAVGDQCMIELAESGTEALELISDLKSQHQEVAVVLSDYIMPGMKGDELLRKIHEQSPKTLKILLTGQADLPAIGNAIKYAKLYRYVAKPWESEDLKLTVQEAIHSYLQEQKLKQQNLELQRLTQALKQANLELQRLVTIDGLTQLSNRRHFDDYLSHEWRRMTRENQFLSLILCDVDCFKRYNDHYGHLSGDDCLKQVAQAIQSSIHRPADLAARYGGEEFAIILPNTPLNGAITVAQFIQKNIRDLQIPHHNSLVNNMVTISLGVCSMIPSAEFSPEDLIETADQALYSAKQQGRNRFASKIQMTDHKFTNNDSVSAMFPQSAVRDN
ncbi:MAG: diguanylate cyclase [Microcoleaceae cyanobacterium]